MHRYREGFITATDRHAIPYRAWYAEEPEANLLISHGMSEHAGRYGAFAEWLTERGVNTWAIEHRGHGAHCDRGDLGHFADRNGWRKVVSDLNRLKRHIRGQSPNLPLVLLGHSMGSYVALAAVMAEADGYDGLSLTGSGLNPRFLLVIGIVVSWFEKLRLGGRGRSRLMNTVTFQTFNRRFKPNRTVVDWLSSDPGQVDEYLADPLCGFVCTNQFWIDLLRGQLRLYGGAIPARLPVRLISGTEDPVGRFGAGVRKLQNRLKAGDAKRVDVDLIVNARHEVLNEVNREETWATIRSWIQDVSNRSRASA